MSPGERSRVLIAGGGVAGLEALLALSDLAGDRVRLTLLSCADEFVYRPMAVAEPIARGRAARHWLARIAAAAGAELLRGRLAAVDAPSRTAITAAGEELGYEAERVVALPRAVGPRLAGLPCDDDGFVPTDRHGRVRGIDGVWAAGDAIAFAVKQDGLAAQQADAAAESIAAAAGAGIAPQPFRPVLRGIMLTGRGRQWLRYELADGDPEKTVARRARWRPPTKIAGRYLGPYLAALDGTDRSDGSPPSGEPIDLDLELDLDLKPSPAAEAPRQLANAISGSLG